MCDIDVRVGLTAEQFVVEYLSVQKPVIVRDALKGITVLV